MSKKSSYYPPKYKSKKSSKNTHKLNSNDNNINPLHKLSIVGQSASIIYSDKLYKEQNDSSSLIPWNVNSSILIDQFDVRSLLSKEPNLEKINVEYDPFDNENNYIRYKYLILAENDKRSSQQIIRDIRFEMKARNGELGPTECEVFFNKKSYDSDDESEEDNYSNNRRNLDRIGRKYGISNFSKKKYKEERSNTNTSKNWDRFSNKRASPVYEDNIQEDNEGNKKERVHALLSKSKNTDIKLTPQQLMMKQIREQLNKKVEEKETKESEKQKERERISQINPSPPIHNKDNYRKRKYDNTNNTPYPKKRKYNTSYSKRRSPSPDYRKRR